MGNSFNFHTIHLSFMNPFVDKLSHLRFEVFTMLNIKICVLEYDAMYSSV
jgi:hypothetical protein